MGLNSFCPSIPFYIFPGLPELGERGFPCLSIAFHRFPGGNICSRTKWVWREDQVLETGVVKGNSRPPPGVSGFHIPLSITSMPGCKKGDRVYYLSKENCACHVHWKAEKVNEESPGWHQLSKRIACTLRLHGRLQWKERKETARGVRMLYRVWRQKHWHHRT